jgi:PleD family two-component response regulator
MATVLRSQNTGLFARSFFLFSLQRELDRLQRYATPVALVLVRATRLDDLRNESVTRYGDYVQAMWKAATAGLRTLDIPCVWSEGVLAIMLPGTQLAGAEVVSQRIAEGFSRDAGPDEAGADQEMVIGCIEASPAHKDAEMLVRDGLGTLGPRDATASDVLVVEDETAVESTVPQP